MEIIPAMQINSRKVINAWCSYDIANSAYNLIITTVLFPIYYQEATKAAFNGVMVPFLGYSVKNTVLYDYTLAAAYMIIVFLSPILSGIADYSGNKKRFMQFFTYVGATSCIGLYWFTGANIGLAVTLSGMAVIGFAGSLVFYNSFLPLIASPDRQDAVSAKGFAWGYAGSVLLLIFNIFTINTYKWWGFVSETSAVRFAFFEVGIWWATVSAFAFWFLKDAPAIGKAGLHIVSKGFIELKKVFNSFAHNPSMARFLMAFFFYSMGVQTVLLVATLFGSTVLNISTTKLIATIVILQIVAMVGATLFAKVSKKLGNKTSLIIMLIIWVAVCFSAFFVVNEYQFYVLAAMVGLVMGGIQSQSRSTYAKLIPRETTDTASFFSFYDVTEKLAIVFGMFSFGFIEQITGTMRNSTLSMSVFFMLGLFFLLLTPLKKHVE